MNPTYWPNGTVRETFNTAAYVYTSYNESGVIVEQRPFTDSEHDTYLPELAVTKALRDKVAAQVPDLLVMITDLNARLDIPKADLSNRELRRTIRDVKQLARVVTQLVRLVGNVLDSTDSGTP